MTTLIATTLLSAGCSARTKVIGQWREPEGPPGPYDKVVAIALARDETVRRIAEDEFARRVSRNAEGVSSYKIVPKEDEEDVDKVVEHLRAAGCDGAAVLRLVEDKNNVVYDPGSYWRPYDTFHNYYGTVWSTYHDPGYLTTEISVQVETAFYSVADAKLVWTGYSETINPKNAEQVIDDVARVIVQELRREKLVK